MLLLKVKGFLIGKIRGVAESRDVGDHAPVSSSREIHIADFLLGLAIVWDKRLMLKLRLVLDGLRSPYCTYIWPALVLKSWIAGDTSF